MCLLVSCSVWIYFFFFKQKTAYEMRISDWSSDVCSSDLIDVEERMYAAGQIPGSFFRSEGRPGEDAILTCRLIDRPLRPTFKKGLRNEVQVVITVMALNPDAPYDVLAINAASLSTQLSGLPFSRSEEHTSELQSLMRISYAVFCLKKQKKIPQ